MKYLIGLLMLLPTTSTAGGFSPRMDHVAHLGVSYSINYTGAHLLTKAGLEPIPAAILSSIGTMALGLIKESTDPVYDGSDVVANLVGTGLSAFTFVAIEF